MSYTFCLICIIILTICEQILLIPLYLYQAPCSLIEHLYKNSWFQSGFFSNILLFVQMHDSNFIIYFTAIIFCFCFLRLFSSCSKITYFVNYSIFSQPLSAFYLKLRQIDAFMPTFCACSSVL